MQDRYMRMMENTEQVPYDVMDQSMNWDWETFPQWMDHLRSLPKGINISTYLPMNALLSYVIGPDEAKRRCATEEEREQMRRILHEALDAGACGFSFSFLGAEGNSHVDYDGSAMPTDVMAAEEAYSLAEVLRDRNEGIIQILCELPGMANPRRDVAEELARRSGRPVLHNILLPSDVNPENHRSVLRWLDAVREEGLDIWSQAFSFRKWLDITPMHFNAWDSIPIFRALSSRSTAEEKLALVSDPAYRRRFKDEYDPKRMSEGGGRIENYLLIDAGGAARFSQFEGRRLSDFATSIESDVTDVFLDLLQESEMRVLFCSEEATPRKIENIAEVLRHPRVLAGISDGGAHSKHGNGGFWSTDLIIWLVRETQAFTLEEVHHLMSGRNAEALQFKDRGTLEPGKAADVVIYDFDELNYEFGRYEIVHDLPGGDWRKVTRAQGIRYILVNGEVTFHDSICTGSTPGTLISNKPALVEGRMAV
jgi:N-acyl-D-aspartate/D-glutamate deacylase